MASLSAIRQRNISREILNARSIPVKRFMGKSLSDVQDELAYFPYTLTEKGGVIRIKLGEKYLLASADLRHDTERTQAPG